MKKIKRFLLFIIFLFALYFLYENYFEQKDNPAPVNKDKVENKENNFIVNEEESDKDKITFYTEGMNSDDFLSAINKKTEYLNKDENQKYESISYNFEKHYTYEELEKIFIKLNKSNSVKTEVIGLSEDNRKMYSIEIGFGENIILMDANVHAAEIANPLYLTKFMVNIVNSYEKDDESTKNLLNNNKIIIVPSQNPDGYEYRLFGPDYINDKNSYVVKNKENVIQDYYKGNINGIDINRNMPSEHGGLYYSDNEPSYTLSLEPSGARLSYYPGKVLGSENETQNIIYWLYKYYKVANGYISLHSSGRSVYNGKPNLPDEFNNLSRKYSEVFEDYTDKYTLYDEFDEDIGYGNDGTTTDFYSELVTGLNFSKITGRLVSDSYESKKTNLKYKSGTITVETLPKFTDDLEIIKNEWYNYNIYDILLDMVKLR